MKHAMRAAAAAAFLSIAAAAASAQSGPTPGVPVDADEDRGHVQLAFEANVVRLNASGDWYPLAVQITAGWRGSRYWAVEAFLATPLVIEGGCSTSCEGDFGGTYGLRAVGYVPVAAHWDLTGDVGLASTRQFLHGSAGPSSQRADPVVGAGLMWRGRGHYSVGVVTSWFTNTHTPMVGVRSEWAF